MLFADPLPVLADAELDYLPGWVDAALADGRGRDHDHGRNRNNHHNLQRFEAFFVIVERANQACQFRGHLRISQ